MAITFLDSDAQTTTSDKGLTASIDSTGAQVIVVFVGVDGSAASVSTPTDSQSNTYTKPVTGPLNSGGQIQMYICEAPTNSATLNLTLTITSGTGDRFVIVSAWSGLASTETYNAAAASSSSLAFTPTGAEDAILTAGLHQGATGITGYGTGQTEIANIDGPTDGSMASTVELSAGTSANTQSFTGGVKIIGLILNASSPTRRIITT